MGLMELVHEQEPVFVSLTEYADQELREDWREITSELARIIAPVADEVELTESYRDCGATRVFRCAWLVRPKPGVPLSGGFELVFDRGSGWYMVDAGSRVYLVNWPDTEPSWGSLEVRRFLKRVLVPVEPEEKGVVWVAAPWDGEAGWDEPQVLVGFWDKYTVEEMSRVVQDGLRPLVTGGDEYFRVTGASIELRGSRVKAYWLRPDRAVESGSLPGDGMLLDAADGWAMRGDPLRAVVLELRDDGMLLVRSDEEEGWATVDLLTIDRVINAAE